MQKVLICCTFVLSGLVGIAHSQDPLGNNSSGPSALYAGAVGEHVGYGGTAERNKEIISIIVAPAAMPAWMAKGAVISSVELLLEVMTVDNVEIYAPVAQNVQEMHASVPAVDWLLAMDNAARLVNFAAVESARTYSVIGTTVGIAGLSARQVQTASMVSVSAIFQARPLVMEHVVRLACWAAAVTHVLTFKVMDRIADDAAILVLVLRSVLEGFAPFLLRL
ncbi:hypothetical protein KXW21_008078 [Aspergillus fumigatus]|nr:hypothetical protein KXW21_008078 [Aspergillus fumigatus]KAH2895205.1 hypothetical protein KXW22_004410 [Aspergillus fumigatus]